MTGQCRKEFSVRSERLLSANALRAEGHDRQMPEGGCALIVRRAREDDCERIARVKRAVWETTYRGVYPDEKLDGFDIPTQAERFRALLADRNAQLYVAVERGEIVGYMSCGGRAREPFSGMQEIGLLYVLREHQGLGVGKALFETARDAMREAGHTEFIVACNKYNAAAQGFYLAMGGAVVSTDADAEDRSVPQVYFRFTAG